METSFPALSQIYKYVKNDDHARRMSASAILVALRDDDRKALPLFVFAGRCFRR